MSRSIFICVKDVMIVENCSESTAKRRIRTIKDSLCKKQHQRITITEYCDYEGITLADFNSNGVNTWFQGAHVC